MVPDCPLCGNSCPNRRFLPLRARVLFCILSGIDHLLGADCRGCCWPIRSFQRCQTACYDLFDDWYYRPPTARQFYRIKGRKGCNQQQTECIINNEQGIEMINLCGHHESSATSRKHKIFFRIQEQTPRTQMHFVDNFNRPRRTHLPVKTLCEIFSFLPADSLLDCNWTSLKLFMVSQILYRPLQKPLMERVIQKLHINLYEKTLQFISANIVFRLNNSDGDELDYSKTTFERKLHRQNPQKLMRSLPTNGMPSHITSIERICLQFDRQCSDIASDLCVPKFLNNLCSNFFGQHAIHYKTVVYSHANVIRNQCKDETVPRWPVQLFRGKRFAAVHLEIEVRNDYGYSDYKRYLQEKPKYEMIGPEPSFYWLFRLEFVRNTPRLWLDFQGADDVLYGDQCLIDECVQWLNLPSLGEANKIASSREQVNGNESAIVSAANFERVLYIGNGNEHSALNMKQIIDFVRILVKDFLNSSENEGEEEQFRNCSWALIVTTHNDIGIDGKIRNFVQMPAEFHIKHPNRGEMLALTHFCAHCYPTRSRPNLMSIQTVRKCDGVAIVKHAVKRCPISHGVKWLSCWNHSFVLRRHPIGPECALERRFAKAHKPNNVIEILPVLSTAKFKPAPKPIFKCSFGTL